MTLMQELEAALVGVIENAVDAGIVAQREGDGYSDIYTPNRLAMRDAIRPIVARWERDRDRLALRGLESEGQTYETCAHVLLNDFGLPMPQDTASRWHCVLLSCRTPEKSFGCSSHEPRKDGGE